MAGREVFFGAECVIASLQGLDLQRFRDEEKKAVSALSKRIRPEEDEIDARKSESIRRSGIFDRADGCYIFCTLLRESDGVLSTHRPNGVDIVSRAPAQRSDSEDDAISNDGDVILDGIEDVDADFFWGFREHPSRCDRNRGGRREKYQSFALLLMCIFFAGNGGRFLQGSRGCGYYYAGKRRVRRIAVNAGCESV